MSFNAGTVLDNLGIPGGGVISDLTGGIFKQSSASAAAASGAIPKLLQLAMAGNLSAVRIIYDRSTTVGVNSEKAVWQPYLQQLEAQHPDYIALANTEAPGYPFSAGTADEVLARALAQPIMVTPGQATNTTGQSQSGKVAGSGGAPTSSNTVKYVLIGAAALVALGAVFYLARR